MTFTHYAQKLPSAFSWALFCNLHGLVHMCLLLQQELHLLSFGMAVGAGFCNLDFLSLHILSLCMMGTRDLRHLMRWHQTKRFLGFFFCLPFAAVPYFMSN